MLLTLNGLLQLQCEQVKKEMYMSKGNAEQCEIFYHGRNIQAVKFMGRLWQVIIMMNWSKWALLHLQREPLSVTRFLMWFSVLLHRGLQITLVMLGICKGSMLYVTCFNFYLQITIWYVVSWSAAVIPCFSFGLVNCRSHLKMSL